MNVKGPNGELSRKISLDMKISIEDGVLTVARPSDDKTHRSLHGLSRSLINNMVVGVTQGFTKNLEIAGVGYRAAKQGKNLNLALGYSHPVIIEPPAGITLDAPNATTITVQGIDYDRRNCRLKVATRSSQLSVRSPKRLGLHEVNRLLRLKSARTRSFGDWRHDICE